MKLLLVTGRFPQRSETFIYRKAVALARRGHDVTVATRTRGEWELYPDPLPPGLTVEVWPPDTELRSPLRALSAAFGGVRGALRDVAGTRALIALVARDPRTRDQPRMHVLRHLPLVARSFDIVHFEFLGLACMYPLARDLTGARIVVSCRGTEAHTLAHRPPRERDAMLDAFRTADAVHCVSNELVETMSALAGRRADVYVNRPAIDVDRIELANHRNTDGVLRLITTGRLVWQKGYDHLLVALAKLRERGVRFHMQILGDGELRRLLAFSIGDLGLDEHVELVGAVSSAEVLRRMRESDVFVLSSVTEGISNAVIEAMAAGLPVVTTDAGGMSEVVADGVEGYVVPVRDPDALTNKLAELAADPDRRRALGRAARAKALAAFSIERQAGGFEEIYAAALGGNATSAR